MVTIKDISTPLICNC